MYLPTGIISGPLILALFSVAVLLAPFVPPADLQSALRRPDALGPVLGGGIIGQGLDVFTHQVPVPGLTSPLGIPPTAVGALLLVTGLGVVLTQLLTDLPTYLLRVAHVAAGALILLTWAAMASFVNPLYWVIGAATVFRGAVTAGLPWWSAYAVRLDARSLRTRVALGLITAAIIPISIVLPSSSPRWISRPFIRPLPFVRPNKVSQVPIVRPKVPIVRDKTPTL